MKTREEIKKEIQDCDDNLLKYDYGYTILEVLLDIRDLLQPVQIQLKEPIDLEFTTPE